MNGLRHMHSADFILSRSFEISKDIQGVQNTHVKKHTYKQYLNYLTPFEISKDFRQCLIYLTPFRNVSLI